MAGPLLETKFHRSRLRRSVVARARLNDALNRGTESTLTLVSAPAGFGKSTLVSEWLDTLPADTRTAAWLSLDPRDNSPAQFWTYVVSALSRSAIDVGTDALLLLESPQLPIDAVIGTLLNDLQATALDIVLVLDDYHVIESREVHEGMELLIEQLPSHVHLVIVGRADPALPLARLRARGSLTEIRAADLRFTPEEALAYLNGVMGLVLTPAEVATLEGRTEGWIAALQLAALSLQGRHDTANFIAGFAGDDRYIVDYLVEEVLLRQSSEVKQFLLKTSILERLTGSLCDAVTGARGGKADLAALERGNLFLIPLDDQRQWYRYHHLFADVLHAHLLDEQADAVPELHLRASAWYESHGDISDAIRHAVAASDFNRAAKLVEQSIPVWRRDRQEALMHSWLLALPKEFVRASPLLSVAMVGSLITMGELEGAEAGLDDAERVLADSLSPETDDAVLLTLPGLIAVYRAALALTQGDLPSTVKNAKRGLTLAPADDLLTRSAAAGLLGLAAWTIGDLEEGHRAYAECSAGLLQAGHVADIFGCAVALADIRLVQGRRLDARSTYEQALRSASEASQQVLRGTADMYVGLAEILREQDDLPAALASLQRSQDLGEHLGLPQNHHRSLIAMARIREAAGDLAAAAELLGEAERVYAGDFFPNVRPIAAMRIRILIKQGSLDQVFNWIDGQGLSTENDLSYMKEFEHITLARALLALKVNQRKAKSTTDIGTYLTRLRESAEEGGRLGSVLELLILEARAAHESGDQVKASASIQRALQLAEPQGYVRIFTDEGKPLTDLLKSVPKNGAGASYASALLAGTKASSTLMPSSQGLMEPLSQRELDVLRLLRSDMDGPNIARELFISLNTLRTHTRSVYLKLGVTNRRAAVRKSEELGILTHS